jgi:hypothetical protein
MLTDIIPIMTTSWQHCFCECGIQIARVGRALSIRVNEYINPQASMHRSKQEPKLSCTRNPPTLLGAVTRESGLCRGIMDTEEEIMWGKSLKESRQNGM